MYPPAHRHAVTRDHTYQPTHHSPPHTHSPPNHHPPFTPSHSHSHTLSLPLAHKQSIFLSAIPNAPATSKLWQAAVKTLFSLWQSKKGLAKDCISLLVNGNITIPSLSLLGVLVDSCSQHEGLEQAEQDSVLTYFSKAVLAGRSKPLQSIIVSSGPIFRRTTHTQFSSILLPATLKCLLRNPDELLEGKSQLLA